MAKPVMCECEEGEVVIKVMVTDTDGTLLDEQGFCESCLVSRSVSQALDALELAEGSRALLRGRAK